MTREQRKGMHVIERVRDAWAVLRGRAKAVPPEANWYIASVGGVSFSGNHYVNVPAQFAPDPRFKITGNWKTA